MSRYVEEKGSEYLPRQELLLLIRICGVIVLIVGLVIVSASLGCAPRYAPVTLESIDGRVEYRLEVALVWQVYETTLTRREGDCQASLLLRGKGQSVALSPDERILAIALSRRDGAVGHWVALVETRTLRLLKELPIEIAQTQGRARGQDGYVPGIQRFDRMALSDGSETLATYFWRPSRWGGHESVVALWETRSGKLLRELRLPEPDESLLTLAHSENVAGMAFSRGGAFLAVSGAWGIKEPQSYLHCFIRVWRVWDGTDMGTMRPERGRFLWDVCLDDSGGYLAGWSWSGQGTQCADISVFSVAEGREVAREALQGGVKGIVWSQERMAFDVHTTRGTRMYVAPTRNAVRLRPDSR